MISQIFPITYFKNTSMRSDEFHNGLTGEVTHKMPGLIRSNATPAALVVNFFRLRTIHLLLDMLDMG